jgi:hypothetical protein
MTLARLALLTGLAGAALVLLGALLATGLPPAVIVAAVATPALLATIAELG